MFQFGPCPVCDLLASHTPFFVGRFYLQLSTIGKFERKKKTSLVFLWLEIYDISLKRMIIVLWVPSGNLTWLLKMAIYSGFSH
jgi:hypothetical protein